MKHYSCFESKVQHLLQLLLQTELRIGYGQNHMKQKLLLHWEKPISCNRSSIHYGYRGFSFHLKNNTTSWKVSSTTSCAHMHMPLSTITQLFFVLNKRSYTRKVTDLLSRKLDACRKLNTNNELSNHFLDTKPQYPFLIYKKSTEIWFLLVFGTKGCRPLTTSVLVFSP